MPQHRLRRLADGRLELTLERPMHDGNLFDKGAASTAIGTIQLVIQRSGGTACSLTGTRTCTCRDCG